MTRTEGQQSGGDTAQEAQKAQEQSNTLAKALAEQMQAQIQDGAIEIEALGQQIIIRIREKRRSRRDPPSCNPSSGR